MTRPAGRPPKLTRADVESMRAIRSLRGWTTDALAHLFNVSGSTARRYLRGECKRHREAA